MNFEGSELQPTKENLFDTLHSDLLGRNENIWYFACLLDQIKNSCSIALDANWGQGKTFFVKHVQLLIESLNPFLTSLSDEEKSDITSIFENLKTTSHDEAPFVSQVCVYYDAWINDDDCDPILSLVCEILKSTSQHYAFKQPIDGISAASALFDIFTGNNTEKILSVFRTKDLLSELKAQKEIHTLVDEFLDSLLPERGDRLIIFIDELDRCKPDYAVRLLERIKHYFTNDRITFVFSVNISELQHTVKKIYGDGFNACRYLDRFFDYRIALPPAQLSNYYNKIGIGNSSHVFENTCKAVIDHYDFGLREIAKYVSLTKKAGYEITHRNGYSGFSDGYAEMFCMCIILPIVIGLRMVDISLYNDFISGRNAQPLLDILGDGNYANGMMGMLYEPSITSENTLKKEDDLLEDKLRKAYKAIFISDEERNWEETEIGQYSFSYKNKQKILEVASMLSRYTKYD